MMRSNKDLNQPHSDICRCTLCMKNFRIPASDVEQHLRQLQATMVDRRNPDNPVKPLMSAVAAHAILTAGTAVDMLSATGLAEVDLPGSYDIGVVEPQELTVKAQWKNKLQEQAKAARDASVFGSLGVLIVESNMRVVSIPKMNALAVPVTFLEKYGAELVPLTQPVKLEPALHPSLEKLYLVEYQFHKDYVEEYALKKAGGGGLFVERHPFPQLFTPLSAECSGALILGIDKGNGVYTFVAFEIPFGYTMKIDPNVIHGDSFFVGAYAIALTDTELADSVLFRKDTPERDIQSVVQTTVKSVKLPLLAEDPLITKLNLQMAIDKIRHEGGSQKPGFFDTLPSQVLIEVRSVSPAAQHAYDKRYGVKIGRA